MFASTVLAFIDALLNT